MGCQLFHKDYPMHNQQVKFHDVCLLPCCESASRRSVSLELVHSDLHGPLPATANGFKYWISFTDDASRYRRCWLLHKQSEAFDAFKHYKAWAEKQTGKSLKSFRDDKGGEYMSNEWERFMLEHGIERQHTVRATPQQNGVAERTNRILDEGVASLLSDSHFPARFCGEALSCYLHTLNLSPSAAVSGKTPFEAFYRRKPSVSHLRVFGCRAYAHVQKDKRRPFEPKSRKCVFVGYPVDYKAWKCWDPATNEVFICRDVRFVETEMPGAELGLSGPRYEPLRGVQPGSVGELAGNVPAPSVSSPSVPPVDPASTHSDNADSDSDSEPDLDDSNDADFVPPVLPDSPSPSPSPERDSPHPDFPPSPSASSPSPSPSSSSDSDSDSANARPPVRTRSHSRSPSAESSPEPELCASSPASPSDARDSRSPSVPYVTRSGRSSRPMREWWKVDHPYQHAREQRRAGRSGSTPESASEADIVALEDANCVRALSEAELIEYGFLTSGSEPHSYKEAMRCDDAGLWLEACQYEYNALQQHDVWELCELPTGRKAVGCRWVYRIKTNSDGTVEKYRARLVAQGFSQKPHLDYTETFAPVAKFVSL